MTVNPFNTDRTPIDRYRIRCASLVSKVGGRIEMVDVMLRLVDVATILSVNALCGIGQPDGHVSDHRTHVSSGTMC
jgi:hypothetical protein